MFLSLPSIGRKFAATAVSAIIATSAFAQAPAPTTGKFTLSSPKMADGALIDRKYGGPQNAQTPCGGENLTPPLQWSNAPAGTKSFAIITFDFEGGRGPGVVHWIAYGIAPEISSLAEGEGSSPSPRLTGGANVRQQPTYFGPCGPNTDQPHHYIYSLYALDVAKDELPAGLTRDQFLEKVKGKILNIASIVGAYARP